MLGLHAAPLLSVWPEVSQLEAGVTVARRTIKNVHELEILSQGILE